MSPPKGPTKWWNYIYIATVWKYRYAQQKQLLCQQNDIPNFRHQCIIYPNTGEHHPTVLISSHSTKGMTYLVIIWWMETINNHQIIKRGMYRVNFHCSMYGFLNHQKKVGLKGQLNFNFLKNIRSKGRWLPPSSQYERLKPSEAG